MNAFVKAHALTKQVMQAGDNYAATFALCLKHIHNEANPMVNMIEEMIQQSKDYIARLEAFKATNPVGYIIVTGSGRLPIKFDQTTAEVTNVESATRFNDRRIAAAKGRQVTNGNQETGVTVYVIDQIEWEISQQQTLITDLIKAKKNAK